MTEKIDSVETPEGGSSSPAGGSVQQADWEKRYKGQVAAYQKLEAKLKKAEEERDAAYAELEETRNGLKNHETEKKSLSDRVKALETENVGLTGQIQSHALKTERVKVIMSEFMDLAPFEARGLLPTADTMEELRQKLADFRTAFKSTVDEGVSKAFQGNAPAGAGSLPNDTVKRTKEEVYDELVTLGGKIDAASRKRYAQVQKEWDDLN